MIAFQPTTGDKIENATDMLGVKYIKQTFRAEQQQKLIVWMFIPYHFKEFILKRIGKILVKL